MTPIYRSGDDLARVARDNCTSCRVPHPGVLHVYEPGEDGWIVASVPEVPGALSQGETREEARANVIDALRGILEWLVGEHALTDPAQDSEQLELVIAV